MKIIIIGGRGTPTVIADQMTDAHDRFGMDIEVLGFALDDLSGGNTIAGYPILCGIRELHEKYGQYEDVRYVYNLYRSDVIKERTELLYSLNFPIERFCNFVHPSVMLARSARMGYGNILLANVVINSNVILGNFNTFNSGTLVGHDTVIGNNNFFAAQVCVGSSLKIGDMNFVGLNSSVKNCITVGNLNLVGMASNVTKNLDDGTIVVGNPAKPFMKNK